MFIVWIKKQMNNGLNNFNKGNLSFSLHNKSLIYIRIKLLCFVKVKAVIVELDELIHRIQTDQHQRKHNKIDESLPICIINSNDVDHGQSTTELSGQFLHSQLLIDCLIKMKSTCK